MRLPDAYALRRLHPHAIARLGAEGVVEDIEVLSNLVAAEL